MLVFSAVAWGVGILGTLLRSFIVIKLLFLFCSKIWVPILAMFLFIYDGKSVWDKNEIIFIIIWKVIIVRLIR